jgi:hypothetical protein
MLSGPPLFELSVDLNQSAIIPLGVALMKIKAKGDTRWHFTATTTTIGYTAA